MLDLLNVIVKGDGTNAFGLSICDNVEDAERLTDRGMPMLINGRYIRGFISPKYTDDRRQRYPV